MTQHANSPFDGIENMPALFDELARRDFGMFLRQVFPLVHGGAPLDYNWHIDAMAHCLNEVDAGRSQRLLVNLPPRNLKSFTTSVAWVAWMLGRDPTRNFLCISYSNELSAKLARDTIALIESARYRLLFPKTIISPKRSANYDFNTTRGGGRLATSITGTLTGRGGDFIIIDDPIKPDDAYSETVREKVNDWYRSTLASRLNDKRNGAILCVMQRLHQYDLCGLMLEDGGWHHLCLPAIAIEDSSYPLTRNQFYHRKQGEALHASREPISVLKRIEQDQGSDTFSAQYQQVPVPAKGSIILAEWLVFMEDDFPTHGEVVQSWDTGIKDGEKNDYSVCVTARLVGKYIYILDVYRKRLLFPGLQQAAVAKAMEYNARTILIEDAASGHALITMLREEKAPGVPFPIARKAEHDKISRVQGVSSMIQSGRMILPGAAPWLTDFKSELLAFPSVRFDDQVDAMSQLLNWVAQRVIRSPITAGPEHIEEGSLSGRPRGPMYEGNPWLAGM